MASCASCAPTALVLYCGGCGGQESFAVALGDKLARFFLRQLRDIGRVGAHIGDQADAAAFADVHAFIELLGQGHRAPGGIAQAPGGFLLQGAGDERR